MLVRTRSHKSRFLSGRILPLTLLFATTFSAESKYLIFQVPPAGSGQAGIPPLPGHLALGKGQMAGFGQSVVKAIGNPWWGQIYHESARRVILVPVDDAQIRLELVRAGGWTELLVICHQRSPHCSGEQTGHRRPCGLFWRENRTDRSPDPRGPGHARRVQGSPDQRAVSVHEAANRPAQPVARWDGSSRLNWLGSREGMVAGSKESSSA